MGRALCHRSLGTPRLLHCAGSSRARRIAHGRGSAVGKEGERRGAQVPAHVPVWLRFAPGTPNVKNVPPGAAWLPPPSSILSSSSESPLSGGSTSWLGSGFAYRRGGTEEIPEEEAGRKCRWYPGVTDLSQHSSVLCGPQDLLSALLLTAGTHLPRGNMGRREDSPGEE